MTKRLLTLALLALCVFPLAAETVVCPDGATRWVSPFNPNPCAVVVKATATPPLFEKIYGKRPTALGALTGWNTNLAEFAAAVPVGEDAQATFNEWGVGEAYRVFFKTGGGILRIVGYKGEFPLESEGFAYMVSAVVQAQQIQAGKRPAKLHPFLDEAAAAVKHLAGVK